MKKGHAEWVKVSRKGAKGAERDLRGKWGEWTSRWYREEQNDEQGSVLVIYGLQRLERLHLIPKHDDGNNGGEGVGEGHGVPHTIDLIVHKHGKNQDGGEQEQHLARER